MCKKQYIHRHTQGKKQKKIKVEMKCDEREKTIPIAKTKPLFSTF